MVPIHLLLVKQALAGRGEAADLTASTKLSLELYERAAVYRALRELYTQGFLEFVGSEGKAVVPSEKEIAQAGAGERVSFQVVRLTRNGLEKARGAGNR